MVTLHLRAVVIGATAAIVLAVPPVLLYKLLYDADVIGRRSSLALVFYAVAMVGFVVGGFVAARKRPDTPLAHGGTAGLAGFVSVQAVAAIFVVARGDTLNAVQIIFNAMLATSLGILGGVLANRRGATSHS
jgi:putative membrane protein (TIGR04086 family)